MLQQPWLLQTVFFDLYQELACVVQAFSMGVILMISAAGSMSESKLVLPRLTADPVSWHICFAVAVNSGSLNSHVFVRPRPPMTSEVHLNVFQCIAQPNTTLLDCMLCL